MRSHFLIVAWAVLAMFVAAHLVSANDRLTGMAACSVTCSGQTPEADNGIGVPPPTDPDDVNDDGN